MEINIKGFLLRTVGLQAQNRSDADIMTGSGGFLNDLVIYGGNHAMDVGSQQFTSRNLTFYK